MKVKVLECSTCKNQFEKPMNEYRRRIKLGKTDFYCSLSCSKKTIQNLEMIKELAKPYRFKGGENRLKTADDIVLGGLKEFSRRVRRRDKFVVEINPSDLLQIWKKQNGKCAITNVNLVLPNSPNYKLVNNNYKASIDRIDSNKPYTIDNIQFLSATMNFLKADMDDNSVNEFIRIVKSI
jgi:hypothetical protein